MNILAIESASTVCGTALFLNSKLVEIDEITQPRIHGERLPVIIDNIFKKHKLGVLPVVRPENIDPKKFNIKNEAYTEDGILYNSDKYFGSYSQFHTFLLLKTLIPSNPLPTY